MATARFPGKSVVDVVEANWTAAPALGRPVCVNGTPWILYLLEECVDNVWEYCSVVIGLISMFCFLLSTLPQVYEAYRNGKVEEAMSFGFLFFLFSGDLTSFAGCYLTSQLPIQMVTVVFYIFTDLILISQFLYYKIKNSSSRKSPVLKWLCFMWCGAATLVLLALPKLIVDNSATLDTQSPTTSKSVEITGYICGYLASIFYLSSRFPQLYKNFQRQSTEGTSYLLFALAMMGNGTYGLSVIVVLPALKGSKQTFIIKHLAWLIGSLGVLILDFFVTAQFIMYRKNNSAKSSMLLSIPEVQPLLCEEVELSLL
ncbi:lysosomal amino acid transporter 1 homolog [Sebastes umbrosus]|uniref:lysosomal amino acid transporter 1 homolog n=1 Tax=Sebastes umbrosus TaxID=72105 RepID=UPI00189F3D6D|nr:lysosomal amino acid transporter 1 homolog [Sebastes umbrosus]XP_037632364.1 lysosomal amino acid transporter 1 homolog [Sebastes umbrosus]